MWNGAYIQVVLKYKFICRHEIKGEIYTPRQPNKDMVESGIQEFKKCWYRMIHKRKYMWVFEILDLIVWN